MELCVGVIVLLIWVTVFAGDGICSYLEAHLLYIIIIIMHWEVGKASLDTRSQLCVVRLYDLLVDNASFSDVFLGRLLVFFAFL